jgi:Zn-dependent alcohol dehydrogenase
MKAALCYEFGEPLVIEDINIDAPESGEVKVRVGVTAICHSDVHVFQGDFRGQLPLVAGHETAGIVEEVGDGVTLVKPGDRVIVSLLRSCGRCFYCVTGAPQKCEADWPLDREHRLHRQNGDPVWQRIWVGGFAEYAIVDQSQCIPIPEDMPLDRASLLACGVITGYGAVINTAGVEAGSSVVVIGTGGVGLNAVQGAVHSGADTIIAVDLLDMKLAAAKTMGATYTFNANQDDLKQAVRDLTAGRGADYVFVTVGSEAAVTQSFSLVRTGGTITLVGMPGGAKVPFRVSQLVESEIRIQGSFMGSTRLRVDVPRLVNLYREGRLKLDELITARYPLDQINEAIEALEKGEALRNLIVF